MYVKSRVCGRAGARAEGLGLGLGFRFREREKRISPKKLWPAFNGAQLCVCVCVREREREGFFLFYILSF